MVENAAPNCSSAIEKQQQQAAFLLRSFGASNLKRAAFFFDYKEFLANGGTVGGLLCQQFISSILFVRHKLLMELFPNLRSTVLLLACYCTIGPSLFEKFLSSPSAYRTSGASKNRDWSDTFSVEICRKLGLYQFWVFFSVP